MGAIPQYLPASALWFLGSPPAEAHGQAGYLNPAYPLVARGASAFAKSTPPAAYCEQPLAMGGLPLLLLLKLVGVYMEEDLRHPPVPQSYFSSSASRLAIAAASCSPAKYPT